jgi:murein DD-endopeptidase MepM/ murein hydrolase activator NlpD
LPEQPSRLRFLGGRRASRVLAHLAVVGLLVVTSMVGLNANAVTDDSAVDAYSFNLVSAVRGATTGHESLLRSAHFELTADPRQRDVLLDRRVLPTPIPTPLATPVEPPPATPEPARRVVVAARPASNGSLLWPVPGGVITTYFSSGHTALDIAGHAGGPVLAADGGTVISAGWRNNGGGWVIEIDHGNGVHTLYNHLGKMLVGVGAQVGRGQQIAVVGCTGNCTGPHVHFEVRVGGVDVNPLRYL